MDEELEIKRRRLPHWTLKGSTYYVTWHLAETVLSLTPEEKDIIVKALLHFQDERYSLLCYVVMDDHVHLVVRPLSEYRLGSLVHSWKSYTANEINKQRGAKGRLWQADRFDRTIRNEKELA